MCPHAAFANSQQRQWPWPVLTPDHYSPLCFPLTQLTGHLKLLGATLRRPLTLLLSNCDAALAVEGGAGLFELLRKLLTLLPRAVVLVSCSADCRALVADCLDLLPLEDGSPAVSSYDLGGGGALVLQAMRLKPRPAGYGLPWATY